MPPVPSPPPANCSSLPLTHSLSHSLSSSLTHTSQRPAWASSACRAALAALLALPPSADGPLAPAAPPTASAARARSSARHEPVEGRGRLLEGSWTVPRNLLHGPPTRRGRRRCAEEAQGSQLGRAPRAGQRGRRGEGGLRAERGRELDVRRDGVAGDEGEPQQHHLDQPEGEWPVPLRQPVQRLQGARTRSLDGSEKVPLRRPVQRLGRNLKQTGAARGGEYARRGGGGGGGGGAERERGHESGDRRGERVEQVEERGAAAACSERAERGRLRRRRRLVLRPAGGGEAGGDRVDDVSAAAAALGRCGDAGGDAVRYAEMGGDVGRCGEMWGDVGRCGDLRRCQRRCAPAGKFQERSRKGLGKGCGDAGGDARPQVLALLSAAAEVLFLGPPERHLA